MQSVQTAPCPGRNRDQRCPAQLRQQAFEHLAQFGQFFLLAALQIPFVHGNHHRAAFGFGIIGDTQILLFKGRADIQKNDHHFGKAHRPQAVGHGKLFHLVADPRLLAHPGGVKNPDRGSHPVGPD